MKTQKVTHQSFLPSNTPNKLVLRRLEKDLTPGFLSTAP